MQIKVNIKRSGQSFPQIAKQERYALALAINRSLEEAQAEQRQSVAARFIDRRGRGLLRNMVKIGPADRATRDHPVGRLRIIGPEGSEGLSSILTRHEVGGPRTTGQGGYSIDPAHRIKGFFYLPTQALRNPFSAIVPRKLYPTSLHLTERRDVVGTQPARVHRTRNGRLQLRGDDRTFVLFGANGAAPIGVFQRKGRSVYGGRGRSAGRRTTFNAGGNVTRDDIRLIWAFRRQVTLKPRLYFYEIVPRVAMQRMPVNYAGFLKVALRTAR
jgi:hypothetical protein